jgi:mannose-1-phosphate guanylyltransferase
MTFEGGLRSGGGEREMEPSGSRSLWAVVLAGGEGVRLRPLVRHLYGDERPKQFSPLLGTRTLLRQTLDRVGLLVPPERTAVVTLQAHGRYLDREFGLRPRPHIVTQPENRGTAAGILLAAQWIEKRDPGAVMVCFPSDHLVLEEAAFMTHVAKVAAFVEREPQWIVLLGAQPSQPETEYGWIEPGARVGGTVQRPIYGIRRFREKPSKEVAEALLTGGGLWNTFVFAARAAVLLSAGRECAPALYDRIARLRAFTGREQERWALRQAYALAPTVNFSRSILEACPQPLAVSTLPGITWCDLGSPERVVNVLTRCGLSTSRLATYTA